jgi:hypothetical protein
VTIPGAKGRGVFEKDNVLQIDMLKTDYVYDHVHVDEHVLVIVDVDDFIS